MEPQAADLFIFAGQSNMAGRGITCEKWPEQAPELIPGAGYEYRAISAPDRLFVMEEPFGRNENRQGGIAEPGMKTGSMATSFANTYYMLTGVPVIGLSASKGGSTIAEWETGTAFLTDALFRYHQAVRFCESHGIRLLHQSLLWSQGESDGDAGTAANAYKTMFDDMWGTWKRAGIPRMFLIGTGEFHPDGSSERRDYSVIRAAQRTLAAENRDIEMAASFYGFLERGLMKDAFHYYQKAYNETGEKTARYVAKALYSK